MFTHSAALVHAHVLSIIAVAMLSLSFSANGYAADPESYEEDPTAPSELTDLMRALQSRNVAIYGAGNTYALTSWPSSPLYGSVPAFPAGRWYGKDGDPAYSAVQHDVLRVCSQMVNGFTTGYTTRTSLEGLNGVNPTAWQAADIAAQQSEWQAIDASVRDLGTSVTGGVSALKTFLRKWTRNVYALGLSTTVDRKNNPIGAVSNHPYAGERIRIVPGTAAPYYQQAWSSDRTGHSEILADGTTAGFVGGLEMTNSYPYGVAITVQGGHEGTTDPDGGGTKGTHHLDQSDFPIRNCSCVVHDQNGCRLVRLVSGM